MQKLKEFREELDLTAKIIELLPSEAGRNKAMAATSVQKAKEWTGKMLGELEVPTPYQANHKTAADIQPTADVKGFVITYGTYVPYPSANPEWGLVQPLPPIQTLSWQDVDDTGKPITVSVDWGNMDYVERIDWLRHRIGKYSDYWTRDSRMAVSELVLHTNGRVSQAAHYLNIQHDQVYIHLSDARMALGNELARLRKQYQASLPDKHMEAPITKDGELEQPIEIELTPVLIEDIPTDPGATRKMTQEEWDQLNEMGIPASDVIPDEVKNAKFDEQGNLDKIVINTIEEVDGDLVDRREEIKLQPAKKKKK